MSDPYPEPEVQEALDAYVKEKVRFDKVHDSGKREQFSTGAVRDTAEGKGRYDLIPGYPLERLAKHYENGAKKYGDDNWLKGMNTRRCLDSLLRHANKVKMGLEDEDHLSAIVFNAFAIIYVKKMIEDKKLPPELDDITIIKERV